jgi:hypothetical protein
LVAPGRGDAFSAREVIDVRDPVIELESECDVAIGHVVRRDLEVPCSESIAGRGGEVGRAREAGSSVDRRQ